MKKKRVILFSIGMIILMFIMTSCVEEEIEVAEEEGIKEEVEGIEKRVLEEVSIEEKKETEKIDKFTLWERPSFFHGAAVHPYVPYGEDENRIYITKQDFEDLKAQGANVVSLNYPGPLNPYPPYELNEEYFEYLDKAITWSEEVDLYVIIHFRNGPGRSEETFYSEDERKDETLWYSEREKEKWAEMWQFVAERYQDKDHIIAYNLMVEPHPETTVNQDPLTATVWINLAKRITTEIREVDNHTPIIVGATGWSNPLSFTDSMPTGDARTIYSFHMYEPYDFTHQGLEWAGKEDRDLVYPGVIPSDIYEETMYWDKKRLEEVLTPVITFQKENKVKIFVGEFGCNRRIPSCIIYLSDLLEIFEEHDWSSTYYLWRDYDDFDYERGLTGETRSSNSEYMKLFRSYWN